ncbi:MAG: hypothetical protein ACLSVD_02725 [Eggerthellaceae bacterium]
MVKGTVCENVPALIDWLTSPGQEDAGLTIKTKTTVTPDFVRAMKPMRSTSRREACTARPTFRYRLGYRLHGSPAHPLGRKAAQAFGANAINKPPRSPAGHRQGCVVLGLRSRRAGRSSCANAAKRHVLEDLDTVGGGCRRGTRAGRLWLRENDAETITGVEYRSIDKRGITYVKDGEERYLKADSILVFKSPGSGLSLYDQLKDLAPEVYSIGACQGPGSTLMVDAVGQGRAVALKL